MRRELALSAATMLVFTGVGIIPLALQVIFIDKVSDFQIALLSTIYWSASFLFSPIWGILSDTTGKRKILLLLSLIISSFIILLHAIYVEYYHILTLRFLFGVFMAAYLPITLSLLLEEADKIEAGRKSSLFNVSRAIGFLASGYVASIILYAIGSIELFIVSSVMIISSTMFIFALKCDETKKLNSTSVLRAKIKLPGTGFIKRNKGHLLIMALTLRHTTIMGLFSLLFVYMLRRGIPDYLLGSISSLNNIAQIVLMYPMGYLSDRIGRKPMYLMGLFLSAMVPIALIYANNPLDFSLVFTLIGVSFSTLIAGVTPFLNDIAPNGREAESMSFLSISRGLGSIIGPIIVGLLVSLASYEIMYIALSIITIISFLIALPTRETLR